MSHCRSKGPCGGDPYGLGAGAGLRQELTVGGGVAGELGDRAAQGARTGRLEEGFALVGFGADEPVPAGAERDGFGGDDPAAPEPERRDGPRHDVGKAQRRR